MNRKYTKIIVLVIFLAALLGSISVLADNNYKVRLRQSDGNGGLIKIKTAASRTAASTAALSDTDHNSDTAAVDVEFIDPNEASYRGQATETTLSSIKTNTDTLVANLPSSRYVVNSATSQAALSTSSGSTIAIAARATRTKLFITNLDGSIDIYFRTSTGVTSSNGERIKAGQTYGPIAPTAAVYAVSASGTPSISWYEEYN